MTEVDRIDSCPSSEQIAAYAEDRLPAAQRAAIDAHLADCDACRELYSHVWQLLQQELPEPQSGPVAVTPDPPIASLPVIDVPWWQKWQTYAGTGGALALAATLTLAVRPEWNPFRQDPYAELIAAVGSNRPVEGRLSGFQYGPLPSRTRGLAVVPLQDHYDLLAIVARIHQRAAEQGTAEHQHASGVAHLLLGELDNAIATLIRSAQASPTASTLSDLAAAYLERGYTLGNPSDFEAGLQATERALRTTPAMPEALYNRARLLHAVGRDSEASLVWKQYLVADPSGPWTRDVPPDAR